MRVYLKLQIHLICEGFVTSIVYGLWYDGYLSMGAFFISFLCIVLYVGVSWLVVVSDFSTDHPFKIPKKFKIARW